MRILISTGVNNDEAARIIPSAVIPGLISLLIKISLFCLNSLNRELRITDRQTDKSNILLQLSCDTVNIFSVCCEKELLLCFSVGSLKD